MKNNAVLVYAMRAFALAIFATAIVTLSLWTAADRVYADTSASSTTSTDTNIDLRNIFDSVLRRGTDAASTSGNANASGSSTSAFHVDVPNITDTVRDLLNGASSAAGGAGTSTATSTGSSGGLGSSIVNMVNGVLGTTTSGLGSSIADSVTGGASGFGTSDFGPFIKCGLIAPIGWPLPAFSTECNASTTNKARLTIIKNTVNGNGSFRFDISGSGTASATISTSGGTASVQFLGNPGTYVIAESAMDGWTQTSRVCVNQNATTTGSASGSLGWSVLLSAGDDVVCTFVNTASSTPGGGGGCTENCGGGGGGNPGGGGGGGNPGSGSSGGGGSTGGGGGNGPILGGGGFSPGEVLGNTISIPEIPGIPNTGAGGAATATIVLLLVSFMIASAGIAVLRQSKN